ncbi:12675_t:CDS:2, partial [Cetraspora pellucida]
MEEQIKEEEIVEDLVKEVSDEIEKESDKVEKDDEKFEVEEEINKKRKSKESQNHKKPSKMFNISSNSNSNTKQFDPSLINEVLSMNLYQEKQEPAALILSGFDD